jgi:hypothetical protein
VAAESAEGFGKPALEVGGGVDDALGDASRLVGESVAAQTPGDERVVEGPDGAAVVSERVTASSPPVVAATKAESTGA